MNRDEYYAALSRAKERESELEHSGFKYIDKIKTASGKWRYIYADAKNAASKATKAVGNYVDKNITGKVSKIKDNTETKAENTINNAKKSLSNTLNNTKNTASDVKEELTATVDKGKNKISEYLKEKQEKKKREKREKIENDINYSVNTVLPMLVNALNNSSVVKEMDQKYDEDYNKRVAEMYVDMGMEVPEKYKKYLKKTK